MKKNRILFAFLFVSFSSFAQTASWTSLASGTTFYLMGVSAPSSSVCYVSGASGTIMKTSDGGTTWIPQTSGTSQNLYSINFVDVNIGFAVGDNGTALKTIDGGTTWTQMAVGTTNGLRCVSFLNSSTGYITGGVSATSGLILKTTDGGTTWASIITPTNVLYGMFFSSTTDGYTVDYDGNVDKTINGGTSWTSSSNGISGIFTDVEFTSPTIGFLTGRNGILRKTINSGSTWINVAVGTTDALTAIAFVDSNNGFIIGGNITSNTGIILSTTNSGISWSVYTPGTSILSKVSFVNANTGYAVGNNGTILKYTSNVGITEKETTLKSFNNYPNPFTLSSTIDYSNYTFEHAASIEINDVTGKVVRIVNGIVNQDKVLIERNNLSPGMYFYKVYDGKTLVGTGKLVAQ